MMATHSQERITGGAKYVALLGTPQYASQVSGASLRVVAAARTGQPLAGK